MSVLYTRVLDINEKVKKLSLTITQWRVLFAVNENTSLEDIKSYVDDDENIINDALHLLLNESLLNAAGETVKAVKKPVIVEKVVESIPEVVEEEIVEDIIEDEVIIEDDIEIDSTIEEAMSEDFEEEFIIEDDDS